MGGGKTQSASKAYGAFMRRDCWELECADFSSQCGISRRASAPKQQLCVSAVARVFEVQWLCSARPRPSPAAGGSASAADDNPPDLGHDRIKGKNASIKIGRIS